MCLIPCIETPIPELNLDFDELTDNCDYIDWDKLDSFTSKLDARLKIVQLNIRGLKGKYNDLIELINTLNSPDILMLWFESIKQMV